MIAAVAGITGIVEAPAGRYEVVEHVGTASTALSAGDETFDARFGSGIRGTWQGDPRDLTKPVTAEVGVEAASIDTVGFRAVSTLARNGKAPSVEVTGTLKKPDAAALARPGLSGEIVLVQADFAVVIKETALASDAGDFDDDGIRFTCHWWCATPAADDQAHGDHGDYDETV